MTALQAPTSVLDFMGLLSGSKVPEDRPASLSMHKF
jgi:hypothetical protein